MLFFILVTIAVTIGFIIWDYNEWGELSAGSFLIAPLIGVLVSLLLTFTCSCLFYPYNSQATVETDKYEIVALRDNMATDGSISGGIFCSRGYIDEDLHYIVLTNEEGKGLTTHKMKSCQSYVNYTDGTPHVVVKRNQASEAWRLWFWDIFASEEYYIYIPTDSTVVNDYEINLE